MPTHSFKLIASAVARRRGELLLVQQRYPGDPHPYWGLPGGQVESGEELAGPSHGDGAQFRVERVMKEDALLSPGLVLSDELKGAPRQGMKGVGDRKDLHVIQVIGCSWPLIRRAKSRGR